MSELYKINLMSSTTKTFASLAESIKVKNTFTLNINS